MVKENRTKEDSQTHSQPLLCFWLLSQDTGLVLSVWYDLMGHMMVGHRKSAGDVQYCRLHRLSRGGCRPQVTSSVLGVLLAHDASVAHLLPLLNYLTAAPGTKCIFSTKVHCNKEILIFMHFFKKFWPRSSSAKLDQCNVATASGQECLKQKQPNFAPNSLNTCSLWPSNYHSHATFHLL